MPSTTPTVSLLVLRAADLEAAHEFYSALGLSFTREKHGSGPEHFSCEADGFVLELYPLKDDSTADNTTMIGIRVVDLDEALAKLTALQIAPKSGTRESEWGRWASVLDPDGRTVRLSE